MFHYNITFSHLLLLSFEYDTTLLRTRITIFFSFVYQFVFIIYISNDEYSKCSATASDCLF